MSRTVTPVPTPSPMPQTKVPHDKVAQRAYEKWIKRGRPQGSDVQDWLEAEAELKGEQARGPAAATTPGRR